MSRIVVIWDGRVRLGGGELLSQVPVNADLFRALFAEFEEVVLLARPLSLDSGSFRFVVPPGALRIVPLPDWTRIPSAARCWAIARVVARKARGARAVLVIGPGSSSLLGLAASRIAGVRRQRLVYLRNAFVEGAAAHLRPGRGSALAVRSAALITALAASALPGHRVAVSEALAGRRRTRWVVAPEIQVGALRAALSDPATRPSAERLAGSVLMVGRLSPEKGIVEAVGHLASSSRITTLTIVGDGPLRDDLHAMLGRLARLGPSNLVITTHERLNHSELYQLMGSSDALVVPSVSEGFGLVAFEAGCLGCRLICTDVGGLRHSAGSFEPTWWDPRTQQLGAVLDGLLADANRPEPLDRSGFEQLLARKSWDDADSLVARLFSAT